MTEQMSLAASEAVRIADSHLRGFPIERRKALATDIIKAIVLCEAEFAGLVKDIIDKASQSDEASS